MRKQLRFFVSYMSALFLRLRLVSLSGCLFSFAFSSFFILFCSAFRYFILYFGVDFLIPIALQFCLFFPLISIFFRARHFRPTLIRYFLFHIFKNAFALSIVAFLRLFLGLSVQILWGRCDCCFIFLALTLFSVKRQFPPFPLPVMVFLITKLRGSLVDFALITWSSLPLRSYPFSVSIKKLNSFFSFLREPWVLCRKYRTTAPAQFLSRGW